ncbi:MAG TPA: cupin domain-containing protein, partial [Solirubrobacteraceae bacterium]
MTLTDQAPNTLLTIDQSGFVESFDHHPYPVRHALAGHPLLSLEALAELSARLPANHVERHRADQDLLTPDGGEDFDVPPAQIARELATGNAWMVLWYVEQVPEYKALLDECLDEVERVVLDRHGPMRQRNAFIFLSAPNATTPVHVDPEQNLLLQIQGTKEMNVGRFADPSIYHGELARVYDGGHRNLAQMPELERCFRMEPGDGTYVYPFAPHWVKNGPGASVSLSITFRTASSKRAEQVLQANAHLRKLHLEPKPFGVSPVRDRVKGAVMTGASRLRRGGRTRPT